MQPLSQPLEVQGSSIENLYQRHWLPLLTSIHQRVASLEDAEDILLEVFLAALENESLLNMNEHRQEAWLRRVAYNKCMDLHRRGRRRPVVPLEKHTEELSDDCLYEPEPTALRREEQARLRQRLATLSPIQQEILRLRFAEELPYAQIAARVHKSETAIRSMLSRTLSLLRDIYGKKGEKKR